MRCKVCQKAVRNPSKSSKLDQTCGNCHKERNGDLRAEKARKASAMMTKVWQERKARGGPFDKHWRDRVIP